MLAAMSNRQRKLGSSFQGRIPGRFSVVMGAAKNTCGIAYLGTIANTHGIVWAKKPSGFVASASNDETNLGMLCGSMTCPNFKNNFFQCL